MNTTSKLFSDARAKSCTYVALDASAVRLRAQSPCQCQGWYDVQSLKGRMQVNNTAINSKYDRVIDWVAWLKPVLRLSYIPLFPLAARINWGSGLFPYGQLAHLIISMTLGRQRAEKSWGSADHGKLFLDCSVQLAGTGHGSPAPSCAAWYLLGTHNSECAAWPTSKSGQERGLRHFDPRRFEWLLNSIPPHRVGAGIWADGPWRRKPGNKIWLAREY